MKKKGSDLRRGAGGVKPIRVIFKNIKDGRHRIVSAFSMSLDTFKRVTEEFYFKMAIFKVHWRLCS